METNSLGKGYLWAANENGGMSWGNVEKKDRGTLEAKGKIPREMKTCQRFRSGQRLRACLGDIDVAHCVQQQLEDEL